MARLTYLKLLTILAAVAFILPSALAYNFELPTSVTFAHNSQTTVPLVVTGLAANQAVVGYTLSSSPTYVNVAIAGSNATFSAKSSSWTGSESVNLTVSVNDSTSQTKTIVAYSSNTAPTISLSSPFKVKVGKYTNDTVAADVDGDSLAVYYDSSIWSTFKITANRLDFTPLDTEVNTFHKLTLTANDGITNSTAAPILFYVAPATDDNSLTYTDFTANDVNTDSETEFYPGDNIDVSFTLYNHLSVDINHVKVKAWIADANNKKTDSVEPDSTTISANDNTDEDFNITVPLDFSLSSDNYPLYLFVQAQGTDENGTTRSVLYVKEMAISRNDHDLAFDTVTITPSPALCGQTADINVDFWNIGVNKETVRLNVKNSDLGINTYTDPFDVKDSGSSREATKTISVLLGDNIKPGDYTLDISAAYNSGKDTKGTTATMTVVCSGYVAGANEGGGNAGTGALTFASTSIDGKQGQQSKISATLKNTGTTAAVYIFELSGIQDWASGFIEPDTVTLAGGASTDVFVYVTPKTSASGNHTATLTAKSGGTVVETETLTVNLPAKPTLSITSLGNLSSMDNTAALLIIVGILVVIGILVLGRKRAAAAAVEPYGKRRGRSSSEEE